MAVKRYKHEPRHEGQGDLNPYTWEKLPIDDFDRQFFRLRFEIELSQTHQQLWRTPWGNYLLPIAKPDGWTVGYVSRQPSWGKLWGVECPRVPDPRFPKTVTYMHAKGPIQAYYRSQRGELGFPDYTVIVEDQISALKLAYAGFNAWALLGVHMDAVKVREIAAQQPRNVIFALDPDATTNAFDMARNWGLAFYRSRVAILDHDLKDTPINDIPTVLGVVT